MAGSGGVRGFLFADLRGYTRFTEAHGDAAAELLADYRELVRAVIGRHAGAEIRTEGDGVYVVFESVTDAVDAGIELVEAAATTTMATPARPIRVAVGIHAGETTATGEGPVGSAVNIAARICAKAEAGEVLVSETVRSLVRTARPYRATALGNQRLKGVAEAIPLYRIERAPSRMAARLRRKARARRRSLAFAGMAVVIALVAAGAAWAVNRQPDCLVLGRDTTDAVVRVDPDRGCAVAVVSVGDRPGTIVASSTGIWIANRDSWTVSLIDVASGRQEIAGVPGTPISIAATPSGDVYVLSHDDRAFGTTSIQRDRVSLVRARDVHVFRSAILKLDDPANTPGQTSFAAVAAWGDRAWVTNTSTGDVIRINVADAGGGLVVVHVADRPDKPSTFMNYRAAGTGPIAQNSGAVWVGNLTEPNLYRVDTSGVGRVSLDAHGGVVALEAADSAIWLLRSDGSLTRYDPALRATTSLHLDGSPSAFAVDATGTLWVLDTGARELRGLDPSTGRTIATVPTGGIPAGIALWTDGTLWVTVTQP